MSDHYDDIQSSVKNKNEKMDGDSRKAINEFLFQIDGHQFVALEGRNWRQDRRKSDHVDVATDLVVGKISSGGGHYVILSHDRDQKDQSPSPTDMLTRREIEVAVLIADGKCDKEIARQLGISGYTVREHIRRIFAKLGVCRRSAVIAKLLRRR